MAKYLLPKCTKEMSSGLLFNGLSIVIFWSLFIVCSFVLTFFSSPVGLSLPLQSHSEHILTFGSKDPRERLCLFYGAPFKTSRWYLAASIAFTRTHIFCDTDNHHPLWILATFRLMPLRVFGIGANLNKILIVEYRLLKSCTHWHA